MMPFQEKKFRKGEYLLHQNENSRHMFVVISGLVRVFRQEGKEVTFFNDVGEGATIGEIALIDGGPRSASAVALEDVVAAVIHLKDLEEATRQCPEWLKALAVTLARRTRVVMNNIERNPRDFFEASLVSLLVYFSVAEGEDKKFSLPDFIIQISEILRVKSGDIESALEKLAGEQKIKIAEGVLTVPDLEVLEAYQKLLRDELARGLLSLQKP